MIEIVGVPFDLCGRREGSSLGPGAIRLAKLSESLRASGVAVVDGGDVPRIESEPPREGLRNFVPALSTYRSVAARVQGAIQAGRIPLVLGGDHSLSIGSIGGAMREHSDLAVLWIDAHADLNTPVASPSGNLHGMPLGVLAGLPSGCDGLVHEQWNLLVEEFGGALSHLAWLGLRTVDPGEQAAIRELASPFPCTMQEVDRHGIEATVHTFDRWMRQTGCSKLWISFDVDVLDPIMAPGTGTAYFGGLTTREGYFLAELLHEVLGEGTYALAGVDVVETNPLVDERNQTARTAVEWVCALFGKTILGYRPDLGFGPVS